MSGGFYINDENRQHVNLSNHAIKIIETDMVRFNKDYKLKNRSGFLNTIIANYYDRFPLSLNVALKQMYFIRDTLTSENFGKKITTTIIDTFKNEIMKNMITEYKEMFPSEQQFKMRLSDKNKELFESLEEAEYFDEYAPRSGVSFYLKILIETYTRLSIEERQKVFYRAILDVVSNSIHHKTYCKIKIKKNYAKKTPIYIQKTPTKTYYEVVCAVEEDGQQYIELLDIREIVSIRELKEKSSVDRRFRESIKNMLEQHFNRDSYKYVEDFVIKFSKNGLERFILEEDKLSIIGLPHQDDKYTYTFNTTETGIFENLFKFGAQAQIISPKDSRDRFKKMYEVAAIEYDKEIEE